MSNALEKFDPGKLAGIVGKENLTLVNDPFAGGISAGEFIPQISIRGNRFRLKIGGEETVLKENSIEVYLVTSRPTISKTFYPGGYNPGAENKSPDCSSADGVYPDSNVEHPVADNCQICPNNAWGSKISSVTGKQSKACSDYKLVVLALAVAPDKPFALRIPAASLKPFASYIGKLNLASVPANAARTRITLGDTEYPSLEFDFVGTVETREDYETITALAESSDVLAAVKIQPRTPVAAAPAQSAVQPVVVPTVEEAPAPAPAPAEPEAPGLADLLGKPKTAAKKKKAVEPEPEPEVVTAPAPEPEVVTAPAPEPSAEEGGQITSLDQLLGKLKG